MKIAGVYKITNNITGELYIGSSKDIKSRWANHKSPSTQKHLPNSKLYQDMSEFGLDNFKFEVLEETSSLKKREQYYIEYLKPTYNDRHADGIDTEKRKETRKYWFQVHQEEYSAKMKTYYQANRDEQLAKYKAYNNRLCLYEGETLTLAALSKRFSYQGIVHPYKEAKKYLIERDFHNFY